MKHNKTFYLIIAIAAIFTNVTFMSCGGSKQATVTPPRRVAIQTPCVGEVMDKRGEYMAGLGISSPNLNERDALLEANRVAVADITTRYIGVIKNGVQSYMKDTTVPSNKKASENNLEGIATSTGSKAINEYADRVCFQTMEVTDEVIITRRCSEPTVGVQAIYRRLKYKSQPFTKRKFVVHKSEFEKMNVDDLQRFVT